MSASHVAVPLGLLHMKKLQRWFGHLRLDPMRHKRHVLTVPPLVQSDLEYWGTPRVLTMGVPLGRATSHVSVFTDASLLGWGGTCLSQAVEGRWDHTPSLHINCLELATVLKVVKHFAPVLKGRHVMVCSDSTTAVAYINRQGSVRSVQLLEIARELLLWAHQNLLSIRAVHVPAKQNCTADLMSRGGPQKKHPWRRGLLCAFPPVPLIPRLLAHMQDKRLRVLLIAPERTSAAWFPTMVQLLAGEPWQLPWQGDALSQLDGVIQQFPVIGQRLWAWPLNRNDWRA
uniref:uncharacterized protein LOC109953712 n=1 Tax=Monopterus albus TaxID=43700 RepID=UPI0009B3336A|nr:uncharacterized protein LOC109953712 [Monopterus albus]